MNENNTELSKESLSNLFLRFLKFGFLAWGGPAAQIAMIRDELVDEKKWVTPERFNRVLAVYQALPGPEAHELCVYFGMVARGRIGAFLAGLGFMTPGFILMFALSWFYVSYGLNLPLVQSIFLGMQPAVAALIVRAVHRIGGHALHDNKWLWAICILAGIAQWIGINFAITLIFAGIIYALVGIGRARLAFTLGLISVFGIIFMAYTFSTESFAAVSTAAEGQSPSAFELLISGLRAGLLTFGGAYTAIPFIQHDAVELGGWMTNAQFLDGRALSGLLPAPLIIFSTFVGYVGGGPVGAIAMTIGIFLPAFAFTMIGHDFLEKIVENTSAHAFLDGVTGGVVGIIAATALAIVFDTVTSLNAGVIFIAGLILLFVSKSKWTVVWVVIGAGMYGYIFM